MIVQAWINHNNAHGIEHESAYRIDHGAVDCINHDDEGVYGTDWLNHENNDTDQSPCC